MIVPKLACAWAFPVPTSALLQAAIACAIVFADSWLAEQQGGAAPAAAQAQTVENAAPATAAAAE